MQTFLKSTEWKKLNVGFALDEGLANPSEEFTVFYGERMPWCNRLINLHSIVFITLELLTSNCYRGQSDLSRESWSWISIYRRYCC